MTRDKTVGCASLLAVMVCLIVAVGQAGEAAGNGPQPLSTVALITIGEARAMGAGATVTLRDKIVTRTVSGFTGPRYYIEEPDRSAGIAVELSRTYAPGTIVTVSGTVALDGGELVVTNATDTVSTSPPTPLAPLGMAEKDIPANLAEGLLVRVWGTVVQSGPSGNFRIDDGSSLTDPSGFVGLRIFSAGFVSAPANGKFVIVTGVCGRISGSHGVGLPVVYVKDSADVITVP